MTITVALSTITTTIYIISCSGTQWFDIFTCSRRPEHVKPLASWLCDKAVPPCLLGRCRCSDEATQAQAAPQGSGPFFVFLAGVTLYDNTIVDVLRISSARRPNGESSERARV